MRILLEIFLLILGFALLVKGADIFVDSSVAIARKLKIPNIIIGLTIVSMGTGLPEAVVSIAAALGGSTTLALGNVVGSNIFNLLIAIGLCALVSPISVKLNEISRDVWISIGATVILLFMIVAFSDEIPRMGGLVFLVAFVAYMIFLVRQALKNKNDDKKDIIEESAAPQKPIAKSILFAIFSIALIVGGGQLAVSNAVNIARAMGITERVVGLTIVAVGTSLPELITSFVAIRKKENDIAIGNIIGSNIFNIMFVLGLSGIITPISVYGNLVFDVAVLTAGSLIFLVFAHTGKKVVRFEGAFMVSMYAAYMIFIILH